MDKLKKPLFWRIFDKILDIVGTIGGILVFILLVLTLLQVFTRYSSHPILWTTSLMLNLLLFLGYPCSAYMLRGDFHVSIDVVISLLPKRVQAIMNTVMSVVGFVTMIFITKAAWFTTKKLLLAGTMTVGEIIIPKWTHGASILFGAILLSIEFIRKFLYHLYAVKHGYPEETIDESEELSEEGTASKSYE